MSKSTLLPAGRFAAVLFALVCLRVIGAPSPAGAAQDDPAPARGGAGKAAAPDVPAQDVFAHGDPRQRYFLMGPSDLAAVPEAGLRLLLVLPGGSGGADFKPFVKRIYSNAVPDGYLVAQLVAPKWSADQAQAIVWPTKKNPWPQAKFATEQFVDAVIDDISKRYRIDPRYVFTLSWSSGGPAAYAASLDQDTRVRGSLVAMSVFKAAQLPALERAAGRKYYILHSPQDFIPMRFPEAARDQLAAHGATTKLVTYEGGHGWHGDVFGLIRKGLEWMQE